MQNISDNLFYFLQLPPVADSHTATTSISTFTETSTTTTTTATTSPSTICATPYKTSILYNNQFIYSPSQIYAAGMVNNQFGVYSTSGNTITTFTALWTASQSSTPAGALLNAQCDRNLVVYSSTNSVLWTAGISVNNCNNTFCLQMLNSGNLVWTNTSGAIIWQTNTTISG